MNLTLAEYEQLNPRCELAHEGVTMVFATPSTFTQWRANSIYEKEPWTLEWIAGFNAGEILLDCGANVGMYTIWAAATRQAQVFAFEPEAQNYALLNKNIMLNNLMHRVKAYCMGLTNQNGFFDLHMTDLRIGGSNHAVGDALNYAHQPMQARFTQGCVAWRLDDLIQRGDIPIPHHIKIDVDGFEPRVIEGARVTLANQTVKSLLIETNQNLQIYRDMVAELNAMGFMHDPAQVLRAERKSGAFKGIAEYVFKR